MLGSACLVLAVTPALAETHSVVIGGLGGDPEFAKRFESWSAEIAKALPGTLVFNNATAAQVRSALSSLAQRSTPQDDVVVMLIGHGTFDGHVYKFNLRGPDLTAQQLAELLDAIPSSRQLVVNMTSASGAGLDALRKPDRIVITATRSGTEKNATIFARYWAEALRNPSADTDKNESISALEAFRFAEDRVARFYKEQNRLATEHPRIEGNGAAFVLARYGQTAAASSDPEKARLLARREQLERDIEDLKTRKAAMTDAAYRRRLTALLLELARVQEALDK
ncbi:MAG: hypothetical protein ACM3ZB_08915 [bacterium]